MNVISLLIILKMQAESIFLNTGIATICIPFSLNLPRMQIKKLIISILFILVYSTGIAHALIPHCHHEGTVENLKVSSDDNQGHQHSDHSHHEPSELKISHDEHFDHCLVDLLICVLSETEHPASHYNTCDFISANNTNNILKVNLATAFIGVLHYTNGDSNTKTFSFCSALFYVPPLLQSNSQRGPPTLSC